MQRLSLTAWLLAGALTTQTPVLAQDADGWSAIEPAHAPTAGRRTAAPRGPGAMLQPNAAAPAPGQRLKSAGQPLTGALEGILKLRPLQYTYLPGQGAEGTHYGVSPAELAKVYPQLVKTDLMTGVQSINTSQLTPILIEAIKEQQQQLELLQQQQLQLAQAYASLMQASAARASGAGGFLRRGRALAPKKELQLPQAAPTDSTSVQP